MLQLHEFPLVQDRNISPFCLKVETYCKLANLPFEHVSSSFTKAPRGRLPFIVDQETTITDSSNIISYLKQNYGDPLDQNLSALQHAQGHVLQRTCEESLYFAVVYSRWLDPCGWASVKKLFFANLPPLIKQIVPRLAQRSVRNQLTAQGMGARPAEEIYTYATADLAAIATLLSQSDFAVAEFPTSYDAAVYGALANLVYSSLDTPLEQAVKSLPDLKKYVDRMAQRLKHS